MFCGAQFQPRAWRAPERDRRAIPDFPLADIFKDFR
jgi:hypothetical protein